MDFKLTILAALTLIISLGCSLDPENFAGEDEYILGQKLETIAGLNMNEGPDQNIVSLFDNTTRVIHKFDLDSMKHLKAIKVQNPEEKHVLLYHGEGNFIIDLTTKHLSVFDSEGEAHHDPIEFLGEPVSAAFHQSLGYLVIYDDLNSVGILKLAETGKVEKVWLGGPILGNDVGILSGDINDDGKLILGLTDNSLATVDLEQSLDNQSWVYTSQVSNIEDIKWLAPIPGQPAQVLLGGEKKLALFDLGTGSILDEVTLYSSAKIHKYSKSKDPHIIFRAKETDTQYTLAYVKDSEIKTRVVLNQKGSFLVSNLDLANDKWTAILAQRETKNYYGDPNERLTGRTAVVYNFSSLLATQDVDLMDNTQLKLGSDFVFLLHPSELGYARRTDLTTGRYGEIKFFNIAHIK